MYTYDTKLIKPFKFQSCERDRWTLSVWQTESMRDTEIVTGCLSGYTAVDTLSESCDRTPATAHQITKGSLSLPLQAVTMTIAIVILNDIISYCLLCRLLSYTGLTSHPVPFLTLSRSFVSRFKRPHWIMRFKLYISPEVIGVCVKYATGAVAQVFRSSRFISGILVSFYAPLSAFSAWIYHANFFNHIKGKQCRHQVSIQYVMEHNAGRLSGILNRFQICIILL